eukprot:Lankesteria_metandrocarpae@DN4841_c0_g1_i2.p1
MHVNTKGVDDTVYASATAGVGHLAPTPLLHVRDDIRALKEYAKYTPPDVKNLLVIKVGTSSLMDANTVNPAFSLSNLGRLVDSVVHIQSLGYKVALVTSGAVGAGVMHMKLAQRPTNVVGKQAAAAVGQCRMMRLYEDLFAIKEEKVAQLLITRTDFSDKLRYLNFRNTLLELLNMGVIPVINENDSVASGQLKFGDNDTLAAYCAISLNAKWLILLSDVDFLYTSNPRTDKTAKAIPYVGKLGDVYKLVGAGDTIGSVWGSGGMRTKVIAAKLVSAVGIKTALCHGEHPDRVIGLLNYFKELEDYRAMEEPNAPEIEPFTEMGIGRGMEVGLVSVSKDVEHSLPYIGTVFASQEVQQHLVDQRRWILSLPVRGKLFVDRGAALAIVTKSASLLAVGVVAVEGEFYEGEAVSLYFADSHHLQGQADYVKRVKAGTIQSLYPTPAARGVAHSPRLHPTQDPRLDVDSPPLVPMHESHSAQRLNFDGISEEESVKPELARCLTNYSSQEIEMIRGLRSELFADVLGYDGQAEVADRSNICFVNPTAVG